jgi:ParB/RepB/Spo0J family partition protein
MQALFRGDFSARSARRHRAFYGYFRIGDGNSKGGPIMPQLVTKGLERRRISFVSLIEPNECREPETIPQLSESISKRGLINPPLVRPCGDLFAIAAGRRRWAAIKLLGWETVDVSVLGDEISESDAEAFELIENLHRADLSDGQKAERFCMWLANRPGMEQKDLAAAVALDESTITRYVTILTNGIPEVQEAFLKGEFRSGVGYSIAKRDKSLQLGLLNMRRDGASRDTLEDVGRRRRNGRRSAARVDRIKLLVGGVSVVLAGHGLSFETVIETVGLVGKDARKALEGNLTVKEWAAINQRKAKVK